MTLAEARIVADICNSVGDPYHVADLYHQLCQKLTQFEWRCVMDGNRAIGDITVQAKPSDQVQD